MPGFLARLDVAVLCSRSEGMSNALLEYMAAGRPIVATAVGANEQLVGDGVHGLIVPPGQVAPLAVAIEQSLPERGPAEREWVLWVELWLRAAREPELRPVAAQLYESYREWLVRLLEGGAKAGEFEAGDPGRIADLALGLFDGLGLRVLLEDMSLESAQSLIAETLAPELGLEPADLIVDIGAAQR